VLKKAPGSDFNFLTFMAAITGTLLEDVFIVSLDFA